MGKNAKLGIAAGVAVVLALLGMIAVGPLVGVGVLILGGLGVAALYQRLPEEDDRGGDDDDGGPARSKKKQLQGKKRLDALLEGGTNETKTKARPPASTPPGGGLPTWSGPDAGGADDIAVVEDEPAADWDTWDSEWAGDADTDTVTDEAENPLDNLDQLDDIDPIAEVERLDALEDDEFDALGGLDLEEEDLVVIEDADDDAPVAADAGSSGGAFSFTAAPAVINEDVESADDIMAASQATELELDEDAADSELAKLLAKVQARLAAYE